jgi:Dihydroorotase and related cyclic amidohydrolases
MKTLIKNGLIVTTENEYKGDILIEGTKIEAVGRNLRVEADKTIDAEGMVILPGGVDQHAHFSFEFMGERTKGFETTNAAALGGTTTVIEFVNQEAGKVSLKRWRSIVKNGSRVFLWWITVSTRSLPTRHRKRLKILKICLKQVIRQ